MGDIKQEKYTANEANALYAEYNHFIISWIESNLSIEYFVLHVAEIMIFTMAANILLAAIFFAFGKSILWYLLPLSFIVGLLIMCSLNTDKISKQIIFEVSFVIIIFLALTYFSGRIYDFSYDGNTYHKLAVGLLKNHWNPLSKVPSEYMIEGNGEGAIWVESYCKATWIFGASVYSMTGNIECAKVYTLIGILCAFLISIFFLKKNNKRISFCLVFSVAAASNPIALIQFRTFYVDGFMQVILYILVIALIIATQDNKVRKDIIGLICATMIICGNIKYTGLLYGGVFCISFFLLKSIIILRNNNKRWIRSRITVGILYLILLAVILFWAGSTSYYTNLVNHGTITYPLTGDNPMDIVSGNSPFKESNHFNNLFVSLFSYMDNYFSNSSDSISGFKIPFSVNWEYEKYYLRVPDARISGFGVFFGGLFIVAIIILIVEFVRSKKDKMFWIKFVLFLTCLCMTLVVKESWWARYAPYIFFIVLLALYVILDKKNKKTRYLGMIFSIVLICNNCLSLYWIPWTLNTSMQVETAITSLSERHVFAYTPHHNGAYFNLKDKNVYFTINPELEYEESVEDLGYELIVWKSINE